MRVRRYLFSFDLVVWKVFDSHMSFAAFSSFYLLSVSHSRRGINWIRSLLCPNEEWSSVSPKRCPQVYSFLSSGFWYTFWFQPASLSSQDIPFSSLLSYCLIESHSRTPFLIVFLSVPHYSAMLLSIPNLFHNQATKDTAIQPWLAIDVKEGQICLIIDLTSLKVSYIIYQH